MQQNLRNPLLGEGSENGLDNVVVDDPDSVQSFAQNYIEQQNKSSPLKVGKKAPVSSHDPFYEGSAALILFASIWPRLTTRENCLERLVFFISSLAQKGNQCCDVIRKYYGLNGLRVHAEASYDDSTSFSRSIELFFWVTSWMTHILFPLFYLVALVWDVVDWVKLTGEALPVFRTGLVDIVFGMSQNAEINDGSITSAAFSQRPNTADFCAVFAFLYLVPASLAVTLSCLARKKIISAKFLGKNERLREGQRVYKFFEIFSRATALDHMLIPHAGLLSDSVECPQEGLMRVMNQTREKKPFPINFCVAYQQWSLGLSDRPCDHIAFNLSVTPIVWLACWDYWRMLVMKIYQVVEYGFNRVNCQNQGGKYQWYNEVGAYQCVVCDWPFANLASRFSFESCTERLFSSSRQPIEIVESLATLPGYVIPVPAVDFTKQNWTAWTPTQLREVLILVAEKLNSSLIDLSQPRTTHVSQVQAVVISNFIAGQAHLKSLDLSSLRFVNRSFSLIASALHNLTLQELLIDDTALNAMDFWLALNATSSHLNRISANRVNLSLVNSSSVSRLPTFSDNLSLGLSGVVLNEAGVDWLAVGFDNRSINGLDLSGIDYNKINLLDLLRAPKEIGSLSLSSCNLGDVALVELSKLWGIKAPLNLDISYNEFSDQGLYFLHELVSNLLSLNLAYNDGLDDSISQLSAWLTNSSIQHLNISGIEASQNDWLLLLNSLPQLRSLGMRDARLSDETLQKWVTGGSYVGLQSLDLTNNPLSSNAVSSLAILVNQTNLTRLFLAGSILENVVNQSDWDLLLAGPDALEELDISGSSLSHENLWALSNSFNKNSSLLTLHLARNVDLGSSDWLNFSLSLVDQPRELVGVSFASNEDYNYKMYTQAGQSNQLSFLDIRDLQFNDLALDVLCRSFNYFDSLSISGVEFGQNQLAISGKVQSVGCPLAVSVGSHVFSDPWITLVLFLLYYFLSDLVCSPSSARVSELGFLSGPREKRVGEDIGISLSKD